MGQITRTIYSANLQAHKYLNLDYVDADFTNTTVNERYGVPYAHPSIPTSVSNMSLKYIGIGKGGTLYVSPPTGGVLTVQNDKSVKCTDLYDPIPFIVRQITVDGGGVVNGDLISGGPGGTPDRDSYRMRRVINVGGNNYACYYLKVLNTAGAVLSTNLRTVVAGVSTVVAFAPSSGNLTNTPPSGGSFDISNPSGTFLDVSAKITFSLTPQEMAEIISGCTIIFGDGRYAVINEIALYHGLDLAGCTEVNPSGANATTYIEAMRVQAAAFINQYYALSTYTDTIPMEFDVGCVEPLLS